jgi:hypothetical protein
VFGENMDKFKRNRKSRTSPPRVERMESFLRERSQERILNWKYGLLKPTWETSSGNKAKLKRNRKSRTSPSVEPGADYQLKIWNWSADWGGIFKSREI